MPPADESAPAHRQSRYWRTPLVVVVLFALFLVFAQGVRFLAFPPGWLSPVKLEVEVRLDKQPDDEKSRKDETYLQVFQDIGKGYNENDSRHISTTGTGEYEWIRIVLPFPEWERIRFDGPAKPGLFSIRSVRLVSDREILSWEGNQIPEVLRPVIQVVEIGQDQAGGLIYRSSGPDPQFSFEAESPEPLIFGASRLVRLGFALGCTFASLVLLGWGGLFLVRIWRDLRAPGSSLAGYRGPFALVCIGLLVAGYFMVGTQAEKDPVPQHMAGHNLYFHLTEAFLHGYLNLLEEPSRPLRELENPFDPEANERLRMHDASYFNERYYVYFGPAPVLSLYVPWRVLTGTDLPDRWADGFLLSGALLVLFFILLRVRSFLPGHIGLTGLLFGLFALGCTTGALFLMARSVVYEVALASALFWMAAAVLLGYEGLGKNRSSWLLAAAGLALGMAMASRHSFVLSSGLFVGAAFLHIFFTNYSFGAKVGRFLALVLPVTVIGVLLLLHNYARFGDPLEFGHNYQIGVVDPQSVSFLEPANLVYNTVVNLFQTPAFYSPFPWVHLRGQEILEWVARPDSHIRVEGAIGLLVANPYLLLLPFLGWGRFLRGLNRRGIWVVGVVAGIAILNFIIIALFSYSAPRYSVDYLPWMVLLFCLVWASGSGREAVGKPRWVLGSLLTLTFAWSIYLNFGLALHRIL